MKHDQFEHSNTYRTGSTTPPKAYSGLVAILLVMVVFLAGLVSILSVLNIRLFSAFYESQKAEDIPLALEIGDIPQDDLMTADEKPVSASGNKSIGILGDPVTPVYQQHFKLPEGLFITYVEESTTAHRQGLREGDVLITLDGVPITEDNSLMAFLEQKSLGYECEAVIYRRDTDEQFTVTLTIEEIK